jgi:hypothetical protein
VTADANTYFMEKYHWQGSILIIENYWELKNGAWVNSGGRAMTLSGKLKVVTR